MRLNDLIPVTALKDGHHGYTPSNGILELRETISEKIFNDYNNSINPENILITPGGKPVIFFSSLILGGEENEIIYLFLGKELGARTENAEYYVKGKVDYINLNLCFKICNL